MPTRVLKTITREDFSTLSNNSGSEKSFVSAEPTFSRSDGQSASPTPSSPRSPHSPRAVAAPADSNPLLYTNDTTSSINDFAHYRFNSGIFASGQTAPHPSAKGSYFPQQPRSGGLEPRSPKPRRAPASRSSHGIATRSGPPPALSTQRSYTEAPRLSSPSIDAKVAHPPLTLKRETSNSIESQIQEPRASTNKLTGSSRSQGPQVSSSRPSTSDGVMTGAEGRRYQSLESDDDRDQTLRGNNMLGQRGGRTRDKQSFQQSQDSQEDLFLNLARDQSTDTSQGMSERRRSHFGTSSFSQTRTSRPSSSGRPNTSGGGFGGYQSSPSQIRLHETSFDSTLRHSPGKGPRKSLQGGFSEGRLYAASAHPLDQYERTRKSRGSFGRDTSVEERSPETPMPYGRRRSIREASPGGGLPSHRLSNLPHTSNGGYGSSPMQSPSAMEHGRDRGTSQVAATESTVSTTAPSTVWDELDDLKSRLRKLELTGILPKSSNAAISNVLDERPPTATTTMTTISLSPKHHQKDSASPEAANSKGLGSSNLHPLLQSALAKARTTINPNLYKALETTASDALALAAMTGSAGSQGVSPGAASVVGTANGIDRQLRRKADGMCRSLTELCIALAEDSAFVETTKTGSRSTDVASTDIAPSRAKLPRESGDEPETRSSSRVMSRLEARRASLQASSPFNGRRGSAQESATSSQTATAPQARLEKSSSLSLRKRPSGEDVETSNRPRPPSRATTEIEHTRPSLQTRMSREYTSQHPLPSGVQPSPPIQSALPTRRSYFTSATSSPITPNVQPGNRRYPERSTPPSSAGSARLVEARQRRIASLGQNQSHIAVSSGRLKQSG